MYPPAIGPVTDPGIRRQSFGAVGSTNDLAFEAAASGDTGNLWITAERQTAGRGRQGRDWISEPGNLYASLLLPCVADISVIAQVPLVAAVALCDGLEGVCGPAGAGRFTIKWPNDLLLDGQKIAGILAESRIAGGSRAVVTGFGVNCAHGPDIADYPATSLAAGGMPVAPDDLFLALAEAMASRMTQWDNGRGFLDIRTSWLSRAARLDQPIAVNQPGQTVSGRFGGIDFDGRLILIGSSGEMVISAGDVFFPEMNENGENA
ncbi:MAG: biotin--[acetyl-CoA-carboxylase] ligase [Alphaproteobacteria bacterium]